jgi:hypothetical protein
MLHAGTPVGRDTEHETLREWKADLFRNGLYSYLVTRGRDLRETW